MVSDLGFGRSRRPVPRSCQFPRGYRGVVASNEGCEGMLMNSPSCWVSGCTSSSGGGGGAGGFPGRSRAVCSPGRRWDALGVVGGVMCWVGGLLGSLFLWDGRGRAWTGRGGFVCGGGAVGGGGGVGEVVCCVAGGEGEEGGEERGEEGAGGGGGDGLCGWFFL